ncbi:MAG: sodium:calcium antiporter [Phycisphaeraceae bacterium]
MLALLPGSWFTGLPDTLWGNAALVLIAIVCLAVVIKGADWLVEGAAGLAFRVGMPKVVIGATIVSLGTTSPEAAVSVLAAWGGNAGLALGNGVGSIIADTGLIFGIGCLLARLPADRFILKRQGAVWIGAAVTLALICYGLYAYHGDALLPNGRPAAQLGRGVGVVLLLGLAAYMIASVHWSRQHVAQLKAEAPEGEVPLDPAEAEADQFADGHSLPALLGLGFMGLVLVVIGGDALVQAVSILAERLGIPQVVIAATLVAFGTSMPELMVGVTSIRKGHPELLVGNVIGADILNVLFVIGAAAVAKPLAIIEPGTAAPAIFLYLHLPVMLGMLGMMVAGIFGAVRRGWFARWLGVPLLVLYVGYVVAQFIIATPRTYTGV